ncbi:hypothetical protein FIBSPDRAFT_1055436 [Athelia psychrophila]|uniref:Uncharacterized protein n=1 Tax=Athelia psychrophila TaxID=1759441 RepID=A0A167TQ38_9AGAM|nr:hypothetical protein FIBSPDRAFT_1055436 [Fibularhizoctonia sp. CBS 109695]
MFTYILKQFTPFSECAAMLQALPSSTLTFEIGSHLNITIPGTPAARPRGPCALSWTRRMPRPPPPWPMGRWNQAPLAVSPPTSGSASPRTTYHAFSPQPWIALDHFKLVTLSPRASRALPPAAGDGNDITMRMHCVWADIGDGDAASVAVELDVVLSQDD